MKEWFTSREPRERVILAVGAIATLLIVAWNFLWLPLTDGTQALREDVAFKSDLLVDAQQAAAVAPQSGGAARGAATQSLVVLVDRTAQSHGLGSALTRTRPEGGDAINVTFEGASFDALMSWLVTLHGEYGVSVETAAVQRTQRTGLVNGQIFLRRS